MAYDADVREAFFDAARDFEVLVGAIDPRRLGGPASDEWTVLELLAHASRAFIATKTVLTTPVDPASRRLDSAAAHFRAAFAVPGVHEGIVRRARDAVSDDPVRGVRDLAEEVRPLVERTDVATEVQHFAGRLDFGDTLVTRVTELVLHGVDLQAALDMAITSSPRPARVVRALVLELADRADNLAVACVLTGRPWPARVNVLA